MNMVSMNLQSLKDKKIWTDMGVTLPGFDQ